MSNALKFKKDKLDWSLMPIPAVEGMLRIFMHGDKKYSICDNCKKAIYEGIDLSKNKINIKQCQNCQSESILGGAFNYLEGIPYTDIISACYRHLAAIMQCEDLDSETEELHAFHLMADAAMLAMHQILKIDTDDRRKYESLKRENKQKKKSKRKTRNKRIKRNNK